MNRMLIWENIEHALQYWAPINKYIVWEDNSNVIVK